MRAVLLSSRELTSGVRHFVFESADLENRPFSPGQFVSFSETIGEKRITRAYSIVSPAIKENRFELCLNLVDGGRMSPLLFRMRPGDEIEMKGPLGGFVLKQPISDSIFIASGTGIAPIRSMLLSIPDPAAHRIVLLFGARYCGGLHYWDDLKELPIDARPTLTLPQPGWHGRTGRVQQHLDEAIGDRRDWQFYICGLKAMVDDVRARLKAAGFDRRQIAYEKYD
jgi:CDP-4-dehydro-6-deoxyglucose reductase